MELENVPYNINNKLIKLDEILLMLEKYNITNIIIKDLTEFHYAFTHKSYVCSDERLKSRFKNIKSKDRSYDSSIELIDESYERLEFLGDSVIKLIVSDYLFKRFPDQNEGFMTRIKTKIENRTSLAKLANIIGMGEFMIMSHQMETTIGRNSEKLLEDIFEAFMGALFRSQGSDGFNVCSKLFINIIEEELDLTEILWIDNNYKDQLLKFYHQNKWKYPQYKCVSTRGNAYRKMIEMAVLDNNDQIIAKAIETSKRKAEQEASRLALIYYKQIKSSNHPINPMELRNL